MKKFHKKGRPFVARIRTNQYIRISPVRLIDADGKMLGIKPTTEALTIAREKGLDLVEIAPQAKPPVCKVLDYSKYIYELEKKKRQERKKQRASVLKEIRFKVRIGPHDFETKVNHAREFFRKQDKVRFTVIFRGRENKYKDIGREMLLSLKDKLADIALPQGNMEVSGNRMSLIFAPKK